MKSLIRAFKNIFHDEFVIAITDQNGSVVDGYLGDAKSSREDLIQEAINHYGLREGEFFIFQN